MVLIVDNGPILSDTDDDIEILEDPQLAIDTIQNEDIEILSDPSNEVVSAMDNDDMEILNRVMTGCFTEFFPGLNDDDDDEQPGPSVGSFKEFFNKFKIDATVESLSSPNMVRSVLEKIENAPMRKDQSTQTEQGWLKLI